MTVQGASAANTPLKQLQVAGFLGTVMAIGIRAGLRYPSWADSRFVYVDLNAGSGDNDGIPGSPLIFLDAARSAGIDFDAFMIDKNSAAIHELDLRVSCGYQGFYNGTTRTVDLRVGDNRVEFPMVTELLAREYARTGLKRFGIVYADPNGFKDFDPAQMGAMNATPGLDRIDFLIQMSAAALKWSRSARQRDTTLRDIKEATGKRQCLVRTPNAAWQWTMLYLTNSPKPIQWTKQGFYPWDSAAGQHIVEILNTSAKSRRELRSLHQPPLFGVMEA